MTLDQLAEAMPGIAEALGRLMVNSAIAAFRETGTSLDDALPTISMTFTPKGADKPLRFTLAIEEAAGRDAIHPPISPAYSV